MNWARRPRLADLALAMLLALVSGSASAAESADSAVVLTYHHVSAETARSTSVTPEVFERHLDHLAEHGFTVRPLDEIVRRLRGGGSVPERTVALTFDDAYSSVYSEVFPRLRERGWPFTVFVTPGGIDDGDDAYVTWEQLREMEAAGATIANHSMDHPHMPARRRGETHEQWLTRMRGQITGAQERLEAELASPARLFAWPYGEFSPALQGMLEELDYVGFGQQSGAIGPGSEFTALPRFPMATGFAGLDSFALKVRTAPLPVAATKPASGVLKPGARRPKVELTLDEGPYDPASVRCYVEGEAAKLRRRGGKTPRLAVRPPSRLQPGRTKINCTAPVRGADRWLWYSFLWMKPLPDGSWYRD